MPTSLRLIAVLAGGLMVFDAAGGVVRGADDPTIVSAWKTRDVRVDGRADDWAQVTAIPKGPSVAAINDGEYLYLIIETNDTAVRRMLAPGLVLWIDPSGSRKADVGFQLPASVNLPLGARPGGVPDADAQPFSPSIIEEIDWLGPGKRRRLVETTPDVGVELASGTEAGLLAYEIKLPLAVSPSHPSAVGAEPGRTIAIGLFTPAVPKLARRRDSGPDPNSMGGGYNPYNPYGYSGYGGISTGMPPPPMMTSEPKEEKPPMMKLWLRLQLARR